ncbi:hypothetical protein AC579_2913 [Pseudocercospora musae]|uniref:Uncharacterized protein n=1 Tax=Pseudocercospora musae TaxID=113226 RepID=A0A139IUR9_9PEZI|nr:hypothetical protein AC579_2913 [Pseudocercospora musae]
MPLALPIKFDLLDFLHNFHRVSNLCVGILDTSVSLEQSFEDSRLTSCVARIDHGTDGSDIVSHSDGSKIARPLVRNHKVVAADSDLDKVETESVANPREEVGPFEDDEFADAIEYLDEPTEDQQQDAEQQDNYGAIVDSQRSKRGHNPDSLREYELDDNDANYRRPGPTHTEGSIDHDEDEEGDVDQDAENNDQPKDEDEDEEEIEDEDEKSFYENALRHIYLEDILLSSESPEKHPIGEDLFKEIARYLQGRRGSLLLTAQKLYESGSMLPWLVSVKLLQRRGNLRYRLPNATRKQFKEHVQDR